MRINFALVDGAKIGTGELSQVWKWEPSAKVISRWDNPQKTMQTFLNNLNKKFVLPLGKKWKGVVREWNVTKRNINADYFGFELPDNPRNLELKWKLDLTVIAKNKPEHWNEAFELLKKKVRDNLGPNFELNVEFVTEVNEIIPFDLE
jgi:hypothetical protein